MIVPSMNFKSIRHIIIINYYHMNQGFILWIIMIITVLKVFIIYIAKRFLSHRYRILLSIAKIDYRRYIIKVYYPYISLHYLS